MFLTVNFNQQFPATKHGLLQLLWIFDAEPRRLLLGNIGINIVQLIPILPSSQHWLIWHKAGWDGIIMIANCMEHIDKYANKALE